MPTSNNITGKKLLLFAMKTLPIIAHHLTLEYDLLTGSGEGQLVGN